MKHKVLDSSINFTRWGYMCYYDISKKGVKGWNFYSTTKKILEKKAKPEPWTFLDFNFKAYLANLCKYGTHTDTGDYGVESYAFGTCLVDENGNTHAIVMDIDAHYRDGKSKEETDKEAKETLDRLTAQLDKQNIKYAVECTQANGGYHIWIFSKQTSKLSELYNPLRNIVLSTDMEVFPYIKNNDGGIKSLEEIGGEPARIIRYPGLHKDRKSWSYNIKDPTKLLKTAKDIDDFFDDGDNEMSLVEIAHKLLTILPAITPKSKNVEPEKKKGGRPRKTGTTVVSGNSLGVSSGTLKKIESFILDNFKEGKDAHYDFNYNDFNALVKKVVEDETSDERLVVALKAIDNWYGLIKQPTFTTDINSWCSILDYPDETLGIQTINFFRNCEPSVAFSVFDSMASWDINSLTRKIKYTSAFDSITAKLLYKIEANKVVPLLQTENGVKEATDKDMSIMLDNIYYVLDSKCSGHKLKQKDLHGNTRKTCEVYTQIVRDSGTYFAGKRLDIFKDLDRYVLPEGVTEASLIADICGNIPLDFGGNTGITKDIALKQIRLQLLAAAKAVFIYLPYTDTMVTDAKIKELIRKFSPIKTHLCVRYASVFSGPKGSGKTSIATDGFSLGILDALGFEADQQLVSAGILNNGPSRASTFAILSRGTTLLDLSGYLKYTTTVVFDEYTPSKDKDDSDLLCKHISRAIGSSGRFTLDKDDKAESTLALNIYLALTTDREAIFNYKAGNARRFLHFPLLAMTHLPTEEREQRTVNIRKAVATLIRFYMSQYAKDPNYMQNHTLPEQVVDNNEYSDVIAFCLKRASDTTLCSQVVEKFEACYFSTYTEAKNKNLVNSTYYEAIPNNDRGAQTVEVYRSKGYAWIIAKDTYGILQQYCIWKQEKFVPNRDSAEYKLIHAFLAEKGVESMVMKDKATKKAVRMFHLLFVDPGCEYNYEKDPHDSNSTNEKKTEPVPDI